eukprot:scaffold2262_cov312-Prasinococcus_capsulatus_cf.AAC.2
MLAVGSFSHHEPIIPRREAAAKPARARAGLSRCALAHQARGAAAEAAERARARGGGGSGSGSEMARDGAALRGELAATRGLFIDNEFVRSAAEGARPWAWAWPWAQEQRRLRVVDPFTEDAICTCAAASAADVDRAVAAAHRAFSSGTRRDGRARPLRRQPIPPSVHPFLLRSRERAARSLEPGVRAARGADAGARLM